MVLQTALENKTLTADKPNVKRAAALKQSSLRK